MARIERLQVRLLTPEMQLLKDVADKARMTVSEFTRWTLLSCAAGVMMGDEEQFNGLVSSTGKIIFERSQPERSEVLNT